MALVPKISLKILNIGTKVDIWEKTGPYNSPTNLTGWGTPNIDTSDIIGSTVKIYNYLGTNLLQTFILKDLTTDVYSGVISAPTPSSFKAISANTWNQKDGIYKIQYSIDDGTTIFSNDEQYELVTVNLCNCFEKLVAKTTTLCKGKKLDKYKEVLDELEIFQYGITTSFSNCDFENATKLLENALLLCNTFSDCDCGCNGDC